MKKNGFCKESQSKGKYKKNTYKRNSDQTGSNESLLNGKAIGDIAHIKKGLITVSSSIRFIIFIYSIIRIAIYLIQLYLLIMSKKYIVLNMANFSLYNNQEKSINPFMYYYPGCSKKYFEQN